MNYVVYDKEGRILRTGQCPPDHVQLQAGKGQFAIEGFARDTLHYVLNGVVREKRQIDAVLKGATLTGLPVPCVVVIEGKRYDVADGLAEFVFDYPGPYTVKVEALHYITREYEVTG